MASESESEKRETLADIVAEMRTRSREVKEAFGGRPDGVENMLDIWADRIEAIDSADAWRSLYTPGNAAATRKALIEIDRVVFDKRRHTKEEVEAHRLATEALTVPPRNCDVGSPEEQGIRCLATMRHWRKAYQGDALITAIMKWAQAPCEAEEGGKE